MRAARGRLMIAGEIKRACETKSVARAIVGVGGMRTGHLKDFSAGQAPRMIHDGLHPPQSPPMKASFPLLYPHRLHA